MSALFELNHPEMPDSSVVADHATTRTPARDIRLGDVVVFDNPSWPRRTVAAISTHVATFHNPGRGIPHGCIELWWEPSGVHEGSLSVSQAQELAVAP